mmetsp:Transcript_59235/g.176034  ORF Transcript_59235/g.176034 Transcript_59235/m.176034 type:complete len:213 (-) Transcript_59235:62-700(-)
MQVAAAAGCRWLCPLPPLILPLPEPKFSAMPLPASEVGSVSAFCTVDDGAVAFVFVFAPMIAAASVAVAKGRGHGRDPSRGTNARVGPLIGIGPVLLYFSLIDSAIFFVSAVTRRASTASILPWDLAIIAHPYICNVANYHNWLNILLRKFFLRLGPHIILGCLKSRCLAAARGAARWVLRGGGGGGRVPHRRLYLWVSARQQTGAPFIFTC